MKVLAVIGLALLGLLGFAFTLALLDDAPGPLAVTLHQKSYLEITNIGTGPIRIIETSINDRPECTPRRMQGDNQPVPERTLKVGETAIVFASCFGEVVRTRISTDKGVLTYTFD